MSGWGHPRPRRSKLHAHVRPLDPKATAGHQNAIRSSFQSVDCYLCAKLCRYGYPRRRASARRGDLGRRPARAQPRSARQVDRRAYARPRVPWFGLAVLSIHAATGTEESRVIQGIVTGVGFLGAGVIVRSEKGHHVRGLTTAACVWVTACVGAACAIAQWQIVVIGVVLVLILLVLADRSRERSIDAGRGDRAGLRISRPTERVRLARRCKEIFLLIWESTASGVRPYQVSGLQSVSEELRARRQRNPLPHLKIFFQKRFPSERLPPFWGQKPFLGRFLAEGA